MGGHRMQERRADVGGDLRQLIRGDACRLDVARGQHDLDVGGADGGLTGLGLRAIRRDCMQRQVDS
jgi:hypothetical protein